MRSAALDAARDGRRALDHPDPDPDDAIAWPGEAKIAGTAVEADGPGDGSHRFRIDVTEVVLTSIGTPADHLVIESWHPGRGVERTERR